MNDFINDFLQGQKDCKDGKPRNEYKSTSYQRGYNSERDLKAATDEVKRRQK